MILFSDLSALVDLISSRMGYYRRGESFRLMRVLNSIQAAEERAAFLSIMIYKGQHGTFLPLLDGWRSDPLVRARLEKQIDTCSGTLLFDLLIYLGRPDVPELEKRFVKAVDDFFVNEKKAIGKHCREIGDLTGSTEWDETLSAYGVALRAILRFASFGYLKPFQCLPQIRADFGSHHASVYPLVEPLIQGNLVTDEMLRAFVPAELLKPRAKAIVKVDWEKFPVDEIRIETPKKKSTADQVSEPTSLTPTDIAQLVANVHPSNALDVRRKAMRQLGCLLFEHPLKLMGESLLDDQEDSVAALATQFRLIWLEGSEGPLAALNWGLSVSADDPDSKRTCSREVLWELLMRVADIC